MTLQLDGVMSKKAKILVVEDEAPVALLMVFLLNRVGCKVESAWCAEKALHLAQAEEFNLVLLDADMPGMNGFELYQQLREMPHHRDTPIIFVSGNAISKNQQLALELGAVDFIEKPLSVDDFLSRALAQVSPVEFSTTMTVTEGATA